MQVGNEVTWTSSSSGFTKKKLGIVVLVIPKDTSASNVVAREFGEAPKYVKNWGGARGHESYVIKAGSKLYWPLVSRLRWGEMPREYLLKAITSAAEWLLVSLAASNKERDELSDNRKPWHDLRVRQLARDIMESWDKQGLITYDMSKPSITFISSGVTMISTPDGRIHRSND